MMAKTTGLLKNSEIGREEDSDAAQFRLWVVGLRQCTDQGRGLGRRAVLRLRVVGPRQCTDH